MTMASPRGPGASGRPADWREFLVACQRIGTAPHIVQAGGGNASMKSARRLHVKASGFWLRDSLDKEMFVDLDLGQARAIAAAGEEDFSRAVILAPGNDLKPSIETGFHALLPHRVVLHAHPVNTITSTLTASGRVRLEKALKGRTWTMVEYAQPGARLALALNSAISRQTPDLVVLANHGAIAGADTPDAAARLLTDLEEVLNTPLNAAQPCAATSLPPPEGYIWIEEGPTATLAQQPARASTISGGAIVPDQVVYLGGAPIVASSMDEASRSIAGRKQTHGIAPGLIFTPEGALARADLTAGGLAMIDLVCEIALRLPESEPPALLSLEDELALLNWDAEKHRFQIDSKRSI